MLEPVPNPLAEIPFQATPVVLPAVELPIRLLVIVNIGTRLVLFPRMSIPLPQAEGVYDLEVSLYQKRLTSSLVKGKPLAKRKIQVLILGKIHLPCHNLNPPLGARS